MIPERIQHREGWTSAAANGCTAHGCYTQDTATVDGVCGRRCADHPPTFVPGRAVELAITLGPAAASAYVRTPLPGEAS